MSKEKTYFDKKNCTDKCTDTDSAKNLRCHKKSGIYYSRFYYNDITTGEKREFSKSLRTKDKAEALKRLKSEKEKFLQKFASKISATDESFVLSETSGYFMKYNSSVKYIKNLDKEYHGLQNGSIFHEYPSQRMKEINNLVQQIAYYRDENWLLGLKISSPKEYTEFLAKHGLKTVQDHQCMMNREEIGLEYYYKSELETENLIPSALVQHTHNQILQIAPVDDSQTQETVLVQSQQRTYTIEDISNKVIGTRNFKTKDKIQDDVYRAFDGIGIKKTDIFQPYLCVDTYLTQLIDWLTKQNFCSSTNKHYKAHLVYFFQAAQYLYGSDEAMKIGECINTLRALKLQSKRSKPVEKFTNENLHQIFSKENEFLKTKPYLFWSLIIGMFTGSRRGLALTAQYKNIITKDGICCMDFTDEKKSYKNLASLRILPIHKQILDLGFIEFVNNRQKMLNAPDTAYVFNEIINDKGEVKTTLTKHIDKMLKQLGIKQTPDDRFVFHSCRKTAANTMRDCGVEENYVDGLVGWEGQGTQNKNYVVKNSMEDFIHTNESFDYSFLKEEFAYWKEYWANYFKDK